jgi:hypothetical protein
MEEFFMRVPVKTSSLLGKTGAEAVAEEIRCRAYQLYEERGREDGHDLEDWLRAEDETTGRSERAAV